MKIGLEEDWETPEGYRCAVVLHPAAGHRMGYIFIPSTDKAFREPEYQTFKMGEREYTKLKYEDYDIEVHAGITYGTEAEPGNDYPVAEERTGVWLGFDCAHCDDKPDFEAWGFMFEENDDTTAFDMLKEVDGKLWGKLGAGDDRHIWTTEEVIAECESMSRQIYIMTEGHLEKQND